MSIARQLRPLKQAEASPVSAVLRSSEEGLRDIFRKLWRHRLLIAVLTAGLTAVATAALLSLTPTYTAETYVMIEPRLAQVINVEQVVSGLSADAETILGEIQILRSRGLAQKVITKLDLTAKPEFNPTLRPKSRVSLSALGDLIIPDGLRARIPWLARRPAGPAAEAPAEPQGQAGEGVQLTRTVDTFLRNLDIAPAGRSRVLKIAVTSDTPALGAAIANTLADLYILSQLDRKYEATRRAHDWLSDRLADLRTQVEDSEKAVEKFRASAGLLRGRDSTLASQQISEVNTQLIVAQAKRAESEARLRQVQTTLAGGNPGGDDALLEVLQNPLIQGLRQQEASVQRRVAELSMQFGARHPKMLDAKAELADLQAKTRGEITKIVQSLRNEVAVHRAEEGALLASLNKLKLDAVRQNDADVQLRSLEREAEANRTLFQTFLARSKETRTQENFQEPDASVISRADAPLAPSFPKLPLLIPLCFVAAAGASALLALLLELGDRGLRSTDQIEPATGVAPLGLVPLTKGGRFSATPEAQILAKPHSAFSEAIRTLHSGIKLADVDRPSRLLLVTSAQPEEGKSTIVLALAYLMASMGRRVIVIDGDLRRPRLHAALRAPLVPGLSDVLSGGGLDHAIFHDGRSGIDLLAAGIRSPHPPELLGSEKMKQLMQELCVRYDMVIVDSPPTSAVSDSRVLCRAVDKVVYVVRWATTRREVAFRGLREILVAGGDVAGVLLTCVDVKQHAQYEYSDSGMFHGKAKRYYAT